jgi:signal transduction histidine kinase
VKKPTKTHQTLQAYQKLVEIARDLASTLNLDALLERIVRLATDLNNAEEASILLYDPQKKQLFFQASTDQANAPKLRGIIVPAESIAGWVAIHREPVIVDDVHQDSRFFRNIEQMLQFKTRSIVAVPMITKDKLIGVLEVLNKRSDTFTDLDLEVLGVLAGQAAVAIENTRLFQQSDLISELVHEIRTPLGSIHTISYLLQRQGIPESQRIALAQTIQSETQRLNELATNFLDLAHLESGRLAFKMETFDAGELLAECSEVIQPRAGERGIQFQSEIAAALPSLSADRGKIKQVLLNLLSNAVKYNRAGGTIWVRLWVEPGQFWFSVQDSGPGIPAGLLPRLFEKFFRARPDDLATPGTGLGLYICKKIIETHQGQIFLESQEGQGSTFKFYLPVSLT